jgi:hypothetical protein
MVQVMAADETIDAMTAVMIDGLCVTFATQMAVTCTAAIAVSTGNLRVTR